MRFQIPFSIFVFAFGADASALAGEFALKRVDGGGFVVERSAVAQQTSAHGLASIVDLVPLLKDGAAAPEKVDFDAGKKIDGVFTITVGREDGTLARYEGASDVIMFAAPQSAATSGDLTTFSGVVVFALKIDNTGAASPVQRIDSGEIALTRTQKSL